MYFPESSESNFSFPGSTSSLPMFFDDNDDPGDAPHSPDPPSLYQSSPAPSSSHGSTSSPVSSPLNAPSSSATSGSASSHPAPRQFDRITKGVPPVRYQDYVAHGVSNYLVPTRYKQAQGDPLWEAAMQTEFDALHANQTWTVVDRPPPSVPVIGNRWVYALKMFPDGSIERHRARVVALGYTQEYGIDYGETFAPVAKMTTVRTLIAVAAQKNWPLFQMDVKNAFLHGDLEEVIYMERLPGYNVGKPGQVCLLHRSLYGLKQAPRAWFAKFQSTIRSMGYSQSLNDPSLFIRSTPHGLVLLLLYVDDMIISSTDSAGIQKPKDGLSSAFRIKDLGELSFFLGLEVSRNSTGILLSQRKYIGDLLDDHNFSECHPVSTPMELNLKLSSQSGAQLADGRQYRSIVGSLIYLSATRSDISYAVQIVSQFMANPTVDHLAVVHRILRYLKGTQDLGIHFPIGGPAKLSAYSDSDYAGCIDTRRSTSGWCVRFGEAFISWRCKKQDKVSKSSTEAEYRSMSEVVSELEWLHRLLKDFSVHSALPMDLFVDNMSVVRIAVNPVLDDRTKHIEVHVHYVRDLVHDGTIQLHYVRTSDQLADLLTKAFPAQRHRFLSDKLLLLDRHQFGGGC
ncbi:unnamed protein product [Linum trigynum]|uniref:Reverse transcriptase Ty1/copia-type domain-containing protein n=1 Tax=Linum trigynum TaxID=586398 RepID=A0AAV2EWS7_9ROSI